MLPETSVIRGGYRLTLQFVLASLPAVIIGAVTIGHAVSASISDGTVEPATLGWRAAIVGRLSAEAGATSTADALIVGSIVIAPLILTAALFALAVELAFAVTRARAVDPGWPMAAWLFVALLPPLVPLPVAMLGIGAGLALGSLVFGGTGRYIVSPALLGVTLLQLSYPAAFAADAWLPTSSIVPTWTMLGDGGVDALKDAGLSLWQIFVAGQIGSFGSASALACTAGAVYLVARRTVSWRIVIGALLGLAAGQALVAGFDNAAASVPWYWHAVSGSFAFVAAFVATDPTTMPLTRTGRWAFGLILGSLTVVIRVTNPDHPEATPFALLLASLAAPLVDHVSVVLSARRLAVRARS